jgi:hypothetical protein
MSNEMSIEGPFNDFSPACGIRDANSARASLFEGWSLRTARISRDDAIRKKIGMGRRDDTLNSFL